MRELIGRLVREEEGQTMTEYGLLLALIAVAAIAVLVGLGDKLKGVFTSVSDKLNGSSGS